MNYTKMNDEELENTYVGEAVTLSAVLAILAAAVIAVVVYKCFVSSKGSAQVAGWKFSWA